MEEAARAQQTERERLFVSFWNVCLENIPEGTFIHRRLTPDEARLLVDEARRAGTLSGVSQEDLFAPYKKDEKHDHGKLCRVLGEHYGIALSLRDFLISIDEGGELHHSIHPLQLVEVGDASRLMVVSCSYPPDELLRLAQAEHGLSQGWVRGGDWLAQAVESRGSCCSASVPTN